jgi:hypothetical protein
MKKLFAILFTLFLTLTTHAQLRTDVIEHYGNDTIAGIQCYAGYHSSILFNHELDSMGILQFGETYLELDDKKLITLFCVDNKKLEIQCQKAKRKIYIMNHFKDSVVYIAMLEGNEKIKFHNKIYNLKSGQLMYINRKDKVKISNEKNINQYIQWTKTKERNFNDIPGYVLFNTIAREYNYKIVHLRKNYNTYKCYFNYDLPLEETLKNMCELCERQYKIEGNTIIIY